MIGPTRRAGRHSRVPVFTFVPEPGMPALWAMRIDRAALEHVGATGHVHDFPGLVLFERSGGEVRRQDDSWSIAPGDGFLIRPGELVEVADPDSMVAAGAWGLYFMPAAVASAGPLATETPLSWQAHPLLWPFAVPDDVPLRFHVPPSDLPMWTTGLTTIERELQERADGYQQAAVAQLTLLLVAAARLLDGVRPERPRDSDLLARALAVIERRFAGPLSLADVAAELHLSPGYLTTSLRERTGRT
ncbi:MAG: helix-turn-helix transcriptional regulator, partial [Acidimicrobiaceae bacterium]|nr:helix-turn-helix transcriptional regulator [Acidimicrobiaceae bacterium]